MTSKKKNIKTKKQAIKQLFANKLTLKSRVQNGEKLTKVARELGVKVVQPL